jgi:hypothetical protein
MFDLPVAPVDVSHSPSITIGVNDLDPDDFPVDLARERLFRLTRPRLAALRGVDLGEPDLDRLPIHEHRQGVPVRDPYDLSREILGGEAREWQEQARDRN